MDDVINGCLQRIKDARDIFADSRTFDSSLIVELARDIAVPLTRGGKLVFLGNGGSAAEANHLAAEFIGKCVKDHRPLHAISLSDSNSALTAIANDYGYEFVFSRQVQAQLHEGDILIALSTSGRSRNVINALLAAQALGAETYLWTGNAEVEIPGVKIWKVPSISTPRIQEVHLAWGHIVAEIAETLI
jgi:D-sedoheptulose 7-phosphate isomerase